jgi:hypothetical protein
MFPPQLPSLKYHFPTLYHTFVRGVKRGSQILYKLPNIFCLFKNLGNFYSYRINLKNLKEQATNCTSLP